MVNGPIDDVNYRQASLLVCLAIFATRLKTKNTGRLALLQCCQKTVERYDDKDGLVVLGQASMAEAPGDLWRQ